MKKFFQILLSLFFSNTLFCQIHIAGEINISKQQGIIQADVVLTNLPILSNYSIWLNSGFNIERIVMDSIVLVPTKEYDEQISYESFQYNFKDNNASLQLSESISFKYTGAFPVFDSISKMHEWEDWMGNIAFNGKTVRASNQSAWYPIVYDIKNDKKYDQLTYDLKINCIDCEAIYLSGDIPKTGSSNRFKSTKPVHLLLFVGDFLFLEKEHIFFINSDLTLEKINNLNQVKTQIIKFYENNLKIPYGSELSFVSTKSSALKPGFSFVSYPTITFVGNNTNTWDMNSLFENSSPSLNSKSLVFMAHEIGHYYVGTVYRPKGNLFWAFNEGLTEYLASRYVKDNAEGETYVKLLENYMQNSAKIEKFISLDQVKQKSDIAYDNYRYNYVPLVFSGIESKIGNSKMWEWIRYLMTNDNSTIDYLYVTKSLKQIGISNRKIKEIEDTILKVSNLKLNEFINKSNLKSLKKQ